MEMQMLKLTDTQAKILLASAQREDRSAIVPEGMPKPAAAKVGASLVARKLMREVKSKPEQPIWREIDGRPVSLVILKAGLDAVRELEASEHNVHQPVELDPGSVQGADALEEPASAAAQGTRSPTDANSPTVIKLPSGKTPRSGSKQELIIGMLSAETGASLDELIRATSWLPHTARAALTGLRKRGYSIERSRSNGTTVYRIIEQPATEAAA
ncbi:DUF3489 domain-containing protein [Methylocella sp. CPCC 101449]|uniref:DUF3489 domain-containing protein n=1 Tax=Methylocella sp. CPCC 101449 TaxID=2987531 RepID=UPI00288E69AF|nr:DUF3489 domain-containing protein [Methylocella sp. CPCC 101449]MDT2021201.1 DUF3489 domain-containing protein [Methylocella sp. CPCC 101449]